MNNILTSAYEMGTWLICFHDSELTPGEAFQEMSRLTMLIGTEYILN